MGNAFLCRPLPFVVSAVSNETTAGPATNLQNDRLGRVWQAAPVSSRAVIYVDLPAGLTEIDTVALLATNVAMNADWTVQLSGQPYANFAAGISYSVTTPAVASADGASRPHRQCVRHLATPITARAACIIVDVAAGMLTAGRLVIGRSWNPAETLDFGWDFSVTDRGKSEASDLGLSSDRIGTKHQQFRWAWGFLTPTEARQTGLDLLAYAGRTRPVLFCADPEVADLHNVIGYGKLTEGGRIQQQFVDGYASSFQLDSDLILST
jgi:hypothetical protein